MHFRKHNRNNSFVLNLIAFSIPTNVINLLTISIQKFTLIKIKITYLQMSHFKEYKTNITSLIYLKAALNKININYHLSGQNIILPQTESKNAFFCWNGNSYTLHYDLDFWTHSLTVNSFTEKVMREYSAEKIVKSMDKFGFSIQSYEDSTQSNVYQTVKSKDLVLSRYNY